MSVNPGQAVIPKVKCGRCGGENQATRPFCQFCGYKLTVASPLPPSQVDELKTLQASLNSAQEEKGRLEQLLESAQQELDRVKAKSDSQPTPVRDPGPELHNRVKVAEERVAELEPQVSHWQDKLKATEEKAAALETQLVARAKDLEAAFLDNSSQTGKPNSRLKLITGALTMLGGLGGFGAGHHFTPGDGQAEKVSQLSTLLSKAQKEVNKLQSQMDLTEKSSAQAATESKTQLHAANQKINELTSNLTNQTKQEHTTDTKVVQTKQDLKSAQTQLGEALLKQHSLEQGASQRQAQLQLLNQRVQQLQTELQSRDNEIGTLKSSIAKQATLLPARSGSLLWSGQISRKRRIVIKDGTATPGTLSGNALPGKPCTLSVSDPARVKLRTLPSEKNRWKEVSFDVATGSENPQTVQVQVNWVLSQ